MQDIINASGLNYKDREVVHGMLAKIQRFILKRSANAIREAKRYALSRNRPPKEKQRRCGMCLLLIPLLLAGCAMPKGRIVSVTQSVIGIKVGQNLATGTPELQIGFFRSTFQIVPTSTNQIYAPMVNSSLSLDQKAFSTAIDETFLTGGAEHVPNSVAVIGAMSRGKAPKTSISRPTNGWPMLNWDKNMPPLHPVP